MQVTYEAYGAGGTGFILECLTDNLNRSASEVRAAVMKAGGKMADPGSVMFNFQRQGQVFVSSEASEDQVHLLSPNDCSQAAKLVPILPVSKAQDFPRDSLLSPAVSGLCCKASTVRLAYATLVYPLQLYTPGLDLAGM